MKNIVWLLLFQLLLIALNAIFASAEIAVLSISEAKLERMAEGGNRKAKRLFRLTKEPAKFLATIQVAITLSGFLGSAFAADNFSEPLVNFVSRFINLPKSTLDAIAVVVITLILSYFTLIFGELVPKRLAMKKSEQVALGISGLVSGISFVFKPVVWFLSISTNIVLRICGIDPNEAEDEASEEEIRMLVDVGSEKGTIDPEEKELIQNVFEFNDISAGEVATHRTDVTVLWLKDSDEEWEEIIHESRHTRYPVCGESIDDIVGILNAKDYFRIKNRDRETVLNEAVYPAYFVPAMIKADVLFKNMKKTHNTLAVVLDEYGGMIGIVTVYDLLEELVGELFDEQDEGNEPEAYIEKAGDDIWHLVGNVKLRDIEEQVGVEFDTENDTFTGLAFEALGSIPADGEQDIDIDLDEVTIHINRIDARQIEDATLTVKAVEAESQEIDD